MSTWLTNAAALRSLFSSSPNGIVALNAQGVIVDCNPASTLLSGFNRAELIGRNVREFGGRAFSAFVEEALAATAAGESARRVVEIANKDGSTTNAVITSIPVKDERENVHFFLVAQDVTPQLRAERSLASVQRDLRAILEHMPAPALVFDGNQTVIDINTALLNVTGYQREYFIGRKLEEMVAKERLPQTQRAFAAALSGRVERAPARTRDAHRSNLLFDVTYVPMYAGDDVVGVFALIDNVTQQTTALDEIQRLRQNFQLLFEHNPSVVLAVDTEHYVTDINPAGLRVSGYKRGEIVGENIAKFVPPIQRDRLQTFLNQAVRGETVTFDIDAYAADRRIIEYNATVLPIVSDNRVVGVYGLLENVTERMRAERTVAAQREELLDLEHDFRTLFDSNPDGVALVSTNGTILDVNETAVRMGGRSREEIVGENFRSFFHGGETERAWNFFRRALQGELVRYEVSSQRADGRQLVLDLTNFPKYVQGLVVGVYSVFQDITERKIAHRKLETQAQRIRDLYLLATTPEYTDAQIMSTLQTGCRLLGMESGAIVENTDLPRVDMRYDSLELFAGEDEQLVELAKAVLEHREPVVSYVGETDPSRYSSWIGSRLTAGGNLHGVLLFFSQTRREYDFEEIDQDTLALMSALVGAALERRRTRSHLRTLAYYDSLTGLPNRLLFQERLRDALSPEAERSDTALAVLFFDLDRFKDINDSLGHAMGDRFLQMVAHRLVRAVGDQGTVARMGGDEFIVLVHDCTADEASRLAEKLLHTVDQPYRLDGYEQFMTTSIGVSMYPHHGRDDQTLIKSADIAMYQAKDRGGNAYFIYDPSLERPLQNRLSLEKRLRRAIELQEFVLHYQPIIDVASEKVVSMEALVRWQDPVRGLIFPDEFIPIAEASGLIVQLGDWIIRHAVGQLRKWQRSIAPLSLSINISARQFHQPDLCDRLLEIFQEHDIDPSTVEIEITESMALSDVTHAIETLRQIKSIGSHIAVDDFGTGHSSLNYLRRFDVDNIKIDRSFIAGIGMEPSDETIVKAIIAMSHSLGLRVVAEGVETREQCQFLKAHGCDRVQGYLFSRPVDAAAAEELLRMRGTYRDIG